MDLSLTYSFLYASLSLLLLLLLSSHRWRTDARLPPGPWKLPIIGSLHHFVGRPLLHRAFATLAEQHGPVMHLKLGELSAVIISSPAAAQEIMKTHDISFANRPTNLAHETISYGKKGLAAAPYGAYWRELRKICILELLSAKRVQSFRSVREEEALHLVRSIASLADADSAVNLSPKLIQLANDITSRIIIGSKCRYQEEFLRMLTVGLQAVTGFTLADLFPSFASLSNLLTGMSSKLQRIHRDLDMIIDSIVQEHKQKKASNTQEEQDVIDVLLKIQEDGSLPFPLTDESIKALTLDLFNAGSETSATTTEWVMSELMRNPASMEKAQREVRETLGGKAKVTEEDIYEMSYLKLVIKETLRLHPPAPLLLPRESDEPKEVLGYRIPARAKVLVNAWALARDPQFWEDAGEFRPERFEESTVDFKGTNFEFIPFGAGRRMCPGMTFGLANVELPLACLLYYFDWELPEGDDELDMAEQFTLTSRRRSDLCLRAIPRIACAVD